MIDDINKVTDDQIKAYYEQGREDCYVRITRTGKVRRHHLGEPGYDDLGTREQAVALIRSIRGLA